jgi:magnesium transporter
MLTPHPRPLGEADAVWLDLIDPSDDERRRAAEHIGSELPTRKQLASLALSSRMAPGAELLRISVPAFVPDQGAGGAPTPLGVLLTPRRLVTLRFARSSAFERLLADTARAAAPLSSVALFVGLFEAIAATASDRMQDVSRELSELSHKVFGDRPDHSRALRGVLFEIGRIQRELTRVSAAMLGVERGLAHLCDSAPPWIDKSDVARLVGVRKDLHALSDYDQQMDDKLQFLLDATLGFINNDQNDLIKFLTIASVVTIPPIILAAIWGMNFRSIPEFGWTHGYAFAWTMILLSMLLPLAWFKWKRWF